MKNNALIYLAVGFAGMAILLRTKKKSNKSTNSNGTTITQPVVNDNTNSGSNNSNSGSGTQNTQQNTQVEQQQQVVVVDPQPVTPTYAGLPSNIPDKWKNIKANSRYANEDWLLRAKNGKITNVFLYHEVDKYKVDIKWQNGVVKRGGIIQESYIPKLLEVALYDKASITYQNIITY